MEPVTILGITITSMFYPVLQGIAQEVAKDAAKSYVGRAFKNVFSSSYKKPLTKAVALALAKLLSLIEEELRDGEFDDEQIRNFIPFVKLLVEHPVVCDSLQPLFMEPSYRLDPKALAVAWLELDESMPPLPEEFSWLRISKRLSREVEKIRSRLPELRDTFEVLQDNKNSEALKEIAGLPAGFDLTAYREAMEERFGNLNLDSIDTSGAAYNAARLWSVFVPQSARECHKYLPQLLELPKEQLHRLMDSGELDNAVLEVLEREKRKLRSAYLEQPSRPILEVVADPQFPHQVILGDPGSGKSSLLRFIALAWARQQDPSRLASTTLPILIELRDYNRWECPSGKDFLRYLHEGPNWHRLNQHDLVHLLKESGRAVLLLDGLDEVFDPKEREQVINDIHRFSNEYPETRIVVTSRIVGYKPERLRDAGFRDFMLQDLDAEQITDFLARWHDHTFIDTAEASRKRQRLAEAIKRSPAITLLAGNPLLLTMMAVINRHTELPRERAQLYEEASKVLLHQWDTERNLDDFPGLSDEIDLRAKRTILRRVATQMQQGGKAANIISGEALRRQIEDYLHEELHFPQARAAAGALLEQLRHRNFILCYLGGDSYAFVHRTFMEFFCANDFVWRFERERRLELNDLLKLFHDHSQHDDWREVLRLICGQIDERFIGQIIDYLVKKMNMANRVGRSLPELPLMIWCLSEARLPEKLSVQGEKLWNLTINFFERAYFEATAGDLVQAVKELGRRWPGELIVPKKINFSRDPYGTSYEWPGVVAAVIDDRNLIATFLEDSHSLVQSGAIRALVEHWPDDTTRALLMEHVGKRGVNRKQALESLVEKWPDEDTYTLLMWIVVDDESSSIRRWALVQLVKKWPDNTTRELLVGRAVHDEQPSNRRLALENLVAYWPDDDRRVFLAERATRDYELRIRLAALALMMKRWKDDAARALLEELAVHDKVAAIRSIALSLLEKHWPDDTTRDMLTMQVTQDESGFIRILALGQLLTHWQDDVSRALLEECARNDDEGWVRSLALRLLAEYWPDGTTRELLTECVNQDNAGEARRAALESLVENWSDDATRCLLENHARQDDDNDVRSAAIGKLVKYWPNDDIKILLEECATHDEVGIIRRNAQTLLRCCW